MTSFVNKHVALIFILLFFCRSHFFMERAQTSLSRVFRLEANYYKNYSDIRTRDQYLAHHQSIWGYDSALFRAGTIETYKEKYGERYTRIMFNIK